MNIHLIKHLPTGNYIPRAQGVNGRGGSHLEPSEDKQNARIFYSERSAKIFLTTWLKGKVFSHSGYDQGNPSNDWEGDYYQELSIKPVVSRIREDMEIIKKEIDL